MSSTAQSEFDFLREAINRHLPKPTPVQRADGRTIQIRPVDRERTVEVLDRIIDRFNMMLRATTEAQHLVSVAARRIEALEKIESAARRYWTAHRGARVEFPAGEGRGKEYDAAHEALTAALEAMDRERKPPTPEVL